MNELQIFNDNEFGQIRVLQKNGQPWFVGKDICECLELGNSRMALDRLDDDEKGVSLIDTLGGRQEMQVINEAGLYSLVLGSRKPEAKQFKKWVTHEVLPSIRKTGMYATDELLDNPDLLIAAATKLKEERAARIAAEKQIEKDKPKVIFADTVTASSASILIGELAKILKQNGIDMGQNRLFMRLRKDGYLCKSGENYNLPTQYSMDLGLFEIKKTVTQNPDGSSRVNRTPKVTGKGQIYFINKFKEE